ncbi:MAG: alpha-glucosidase [Clostridia bacterium]|nr:alpha-glucosidase [Clostridia bacterium]
MKWWKEGVVYQIYPRSFSDSNNDGIGDIRGIIAHLDDLSDLGVDVLWLSPVYPSPNADYGYDISDYKSIHKDYGTMDDMMELIHESEKRNIKIVMDLVINHTSDEHEWFKMSRDPESPYRDYYYWRPGKESGPPNNWTSFFAEGCWEYDEVSGEYYMHLFGAKQPDLNYHNPKVVDEIKGVMKFWLEKGVSGFRCDVINIIYKTSLEDGKMKLVLTGSEHYLAQEGAHDILRTLRKDVLSGFDCFTVGETVFVTPEMGKDLCDESRKELDMIFSFEHMETDQFIVKWFKRKFNPKRFADVLFKWQESIEWNANYLENHDQPRSVSRFGDDQNFWKPSAKMLATCLLTLKGTPFIYQGQEIGMTNYGFTKLNQIKDIETHSVVAFAKNLRIPQWYLWSMIRKNSRDNARTPYQWNSKDNAGFSEHEPWILVNPNYLMINRENQEKDPGSVLSYYKMMIRLRKENQVLIEGEFIPLKASKTLMIYQRKLGKQLWTIVLNFSNRSVKYQNEGKIIISNYGDEHIFGMLKPFESAVYDNSHI